MNLFFLLGFSWLASLGFRDYMLNRDSAVIELKTDASVTVTKPTIKTQLGKPFRLLVLDGGGVRGIIQIVFLDALEKATGRPVMDLFDGVIATSVGGAVSSMLLLKDKDGRPKYSAEDIINMLVKDNAFKKIFSRSAARSVLTINGVFGPKYSARGKRKLLQQWFGESRFDELAKPLMLTSWSSITLAPELLTNWTQNGYESFPAWALVHGTTSPPGYFPATHINDQSGKDSTKVLDLNDGGVYANTPTFPAFIESFIKELPSKDKQTLVVVNIGTGFAKEGYSFQKVRNWGAYHWFSPMLSSMGTLSGRLALNEIKKGLGQDKLYFRLFDFNPWLSHDERKIDNTQEKNIRQLVERTREMLHEKREDFKKLIELL